MSIQSFFLKISILALSFCATIYAQEPPFSYKSYGTEDGLPSSEIYCSLQDAKGYMWFGTDAGAVRYNGYNFEVFSTDNGLTNDTVFGLYEDFEGNIWFLTYDGLLSYYSYTDNKIHPYQLNNLLKQTRKSGWIEQIHFSKNRTLYFSYTYAGFGSISATGKLDFEDTTSNDIVEIKKRVIDNQVFLYALQPKNIKNHQQCNLKFLNDTLVFAPKQSFYRRLTKVRPIAKDEFIFSMRNNIFYLKKEKLIDIPVNGGFYDITILENKSIWVVYAHTKGIVVYRNMTDFISGKKAYTFFSDEQMSSTTIGKSGELWITFAQDGIALAPNLEVSKITFENKSSETNNIIDMQFSEDDKLYAVIINFKIFHINDKYPVLKHAGYINLRHKYLSIISKATFKKTNDIHQSLGNFFNPIYLKKIDDSYFFPSKIIHTQKDDLWFIVSNDIISFNANNQRDYQFSKQFDKSTRMWDIFEDYNDNIWVAANNGLYKYNGQQMILQDKVHPFFGKRINDIDELKNGTLVVATKSYGLLLWKEDRFINITEKDGLADAIIRTIWIDEEQTIWVATPSGVSKVVMDGENYSIQNITKTHGLLSNEANVIRTKGNEVWVGTNKGIAHFYKNELMPKSTPVPLYITEIAVNEIPQAVKDTFNLSHKENFLSVSYKSLAYDIQQNEKYRYKMDGIDKDWVETHGRPVRLPNLNHGTYQFNIQAANKHGVWGATKTIVFNIKPPFWKTGWFIGALSTVALLGVFFFLRTREIRRDQKAQKEKELETYKLMALQAQMNPHFIFNTLNSIQYFINKNEIKKSNLYLSNFAKLIRLVLNLSNKSLITIDQELELLQLYLGLEKLRFEDKFEYDIKIDPELQTNFDSLPPMIIQPYVENAVWHGLMNKEGKGLIKITFKSAENDLICSVEDNGIGRKKSAEIKSERQIKKKSYGMGVTKKRLASLNKIEEDQERNVTVIDLYDDAQNPLGTKIIIKINLN